MLNHNGPVTGLRGSIASDPSCSKKPGCCIPFATRLAYFSINHGRMQQPWLPGPVTVAQTVLYIGIKIMTHNSQTESLTGEALPSSSWPGTGVERRLLHDWHLKTYMT